MLSPNNPLVAFIGEIFSRLKQKSPLFFIIWQWISGAVVAVTGIPEVLTATGVHLTGVFLQVENTAVTVAAGLVLFFSALPVKSDTVAVSTNGQPLKSTNQSALPFTAKAENKIASVENHPVVAITTPSKN